MVKKILVTEIKDVKAPLTVLPILHPQKKKFRRARVELIHRNFMWAYFCMKCGYFHKWDSKICEKHREYASNG